MKNEIILYNANTVSNRIEVRIEDETVWLTRRQIATLFNRDVKTIGKHINTIFSEGELDKTATVANFETVQNEGGRMVERHIDYYNLDIIISVGYRVKSKEGTQFRIWANKILKDYLLKGYSLNKRMNRLDDNLHALTERIDNIDLQISTSSLPTQGVFYKDQIFDAYKFVSDIIRSAKKSIVVIDNYVDDTVLTHLIKKAINVNVLILTKNISKQLALDIQKANAQHYNIRAKVFKDSHDRFLIIDQTEVYHIGASLKDLGKKIFAFSKLEASSVAFLQSIKDILVET